MPRKGTRTYRKKTAVGLSKSSVQKLTAIAEKTEDETFADLIKDFDIQAVKMKKQSKRFFTNEMKKMLQYLPQKSSIPKEILKMSAYEFKERGGTLRAVTQSWRSGVLPEKSSVQQSLPTIATDKENKSKLDPIDPAFVTPAFNTRSKALTATGTTTAKRQPKPLEQVALSVHATDSGSPVDEDLFLKLKLGQVVENYESEVLEAASLFPQKWRSQLQKVLKNTRMRMKSQVEEQCFQTPALPR